MLTEKRTEKHAEKRTEKRTEKRNDFTEFFHRFFPRIFGVCFAAVRTVHANEKRPPKNSAKKSIAGTEQNPECRCGRGGSRSTCPFEKQKLSRKTENVFSSQFCTSLFCNNPSLSPSEAVLSTYHTDDALVSFWGCLVGHVEITARLHLL